MKTCAAYTWTFTVHAQIILPNQCYSGNDQEREGPAGSHLGAVINRSSIHLKTLCDQESKFHSLTALIPLTSQKYMHNECIPFEVWAHKLSIPSPRMVIGNIKGVGESSAELHIYLQ